MAELYFCEWMDKRKKVIIIGGPTAAGKTSMAIEVARHLSTEIISADSRQCYKEMKIGVARPSEEELSMVPHHFIASHSIEEKVTAATFEAYALEKATAIFQNNDVLVMVGGTGLYIKAFCEGLDIIPDVPEEVRNSIIQTFNEKGLPWLQAAVQQKDPLFFATGENRNPHRLMRALEVVEFTGQSILSFRRGIKAQREFDIIKVVLSPDKEQLHANINHRVDVMMEMGLLDEVRNLWDYRHLNALQTVGYRELYEYLDGHTDLESAVDQIKRNTRQYAKRQLTWFKRDTLYRWFAPSEKTSLLAYIQEQV